MMNLNVKEVIWDVVETIVLFVIAAFVVYTVLMFVRNFGYSPKLGIYYTRAYSFSVGDIIHGNDVTYTYTHLNLWEILDKIY